MLGSMKQENYLATAITPSPGSFTITANISRNNLNRLYSNTVGSYTYLTFQPAWAITSGGGNPYIDYSFQGKSQPGNIVVSNGPALIDILLVGAGGGGANLSGGGGQVRFYSNVIVSPGTYNLYTPSGTTFTTAYTGASANITIGSTTISASGGSVTANNTVGGDGAGTNHSGVQGGDGISIPNFGTDVTWLGEAHSLPSDGNIWYGPGGSGVNAYNTQTPGGYSGGAYGWYTLVVNPTVSVNDPWPSVGGGGGAGGGDAASTGGSGGSGGGVVIIRYKSS